MSYSYLILVLTIVCVFSLTTGLNIEDADLHWNKLEFPAIFYLKADKYDVLSRTIFPLEIWQENTNSRMDYYNRTNRMYYLRKGKEIYYVHPESSDSKTYNFKCRQLKPNHYSAELLPPAVIFKKPEYYKGEDMYDGKIIRKYQRELRTKKAIMTATLWTTTTPDNKDIPVRYENKLDYISTGKVLLHEITTYYNYNGNVPSDIFDDYQDFGCDASDIDDINELLKLHPDHHGHVDIAFHNYKQIHSKVYDDLFEHELRKFVFNNNLRRVIDHNNKNSSYKLELNHFADRTDDEIDALNGLRPSDPKEFGTIPFLEKGVDEIRELPEEYDIRLVGVITPVKNQGNCGSCWSFSTTAAVEGAISLNNGGINLDLSEQSLIDCAWQFKDRGCKGGHIDTTLRYVLQNGIPTEREYGVYLQQNGLCHMGNISEERVQRIRGFAKVTPLSESSLKYAIYKNGPVIAAIATTENMKLYSNGIFYDPDCDGKNISHAVTVVGYGKSYNQTYWIVKNSWGVDWGEDGYILMSAKNNNCLLMTDLYYPVV